MWKYARVAEHANFGAFAGPLAREAHFIVRGALNESEAHPIAVGSTTDGRPVAFTHRGGVRFAIVQGAAHDEVSFPCARPGEGAEVRMLGNSRVLPHSWSEGNLRVFLPDHLPDAPATAFSIGG